MKKHTYLLIAGIVLAFSSCTSNAEAEKPHSETTHEEHYHGDETIALDKGEKWTVNAEMMPHIASMKAEMVDFGKKEEKDYQVLATALQADIDLLTSSCTMSGKAHDELHKWLVPHIGLVSDLAEATNIEEADATFNKLQGSFKTFDTYFK